jgi:eukaryotic-like serine/threonine-protein kinase
MKATVQKRSHESRPHAKSRRQLRGDLDNIVLKALRKEPERRYVSVEQFAEDIRRYLEGMPVSAAPDSFHYRFNKFIRRHELGVAAVFLIVVVLAGGVLATLRQARIAAANEKRAEARFNDVRALADSMLFDVHDSIANLPGATSARRVLVDRAVLYLDSLSHEATGDPDLQRELASAYQRLGDVQGEPRAAALGDSAGALRNYLKALQLREELAQSSGANNEDRLRLGEIHRAVAEMSHFSGNLGGALEHARKAVSADSSVFDAEGGDRAKIALELARAYKALAESEWSGMAFGSLAEQTPALDDYQHGLAIASAELEHEPGNAALARQREFLRMRIGRTLAQNGSRSKAIQELRSVLSYFRSVGTVANNTRSQRDLGTALEELGLALERDGRFPEAMSCFKEEMTMITTLFKSDPGNLQAQFDWIGANFNIAESLVRLGKPRQALPLIRRMTKDEEQIISTDPTRVEYRTWLGYFRVMEGEALTELHHDREALSSFQAARDLYEGVVRSDPLDMDERLSASAAETKIAAALLHLGDRDRARETYQRAASASEPAATSSDPKQQAQYTLADSYSGLGDISFSRSLLPDACAWYEKSLHVWHAIPNPSLISPNGFDTEGPARVERQLVLSKCKQ